MPKAGKKFVNHDIAYAKLDERTTVHCQDKRSNAKYRNTVLDIVPVIFAPDGNSALFARKSNWQHNFRQRLDEVYQAKLQPVSAANCKLGLKVEAKISHDTDVWVKGTVVDAQENIVVVELKLHDGSVDPRVVDINNLRLSEVISKFSARNYHQIVLSIPKAIPKFMKLDEFMQPIISNVGEASFCISGEKLIVLSLDESSITSFESFCDVYISTCLKRCQLLRVLGEKKPPSSRHTIRVVKFDVELAGLIIGKRGENINKAAKIAGVSSVDIDADKGEITIVGSAQAVDKAEEIVSIVRKTFQVPAHLTGFLIGKNFSNIDRIVRLSQAVSIRPPNQKNDGDKSKDASNEQTDTFTITGTRISVSVAQTLLMFLINNRKATGELRQTILQLDQQHRPKMSSANVQAVPKVNNNPVKKKSEASPNGGQKPAPKSAKPKNKPSKNSVKTAKVAKKNNSEKTQEGARQVVF